MLGWCNVTDVRFRRVRIRPLGLYDARVRSLANAFGPVGVTLEFNPAYMVNRLLIDPHCTKRLSGQWPGPNVAHLPSLFGDKQ